MNVDLITILILIIIFIVSVIIGIIFAAIYRRGSQSIKYRELDKKRLVISRSVIEHFAIGNIFEKEQDLRSRTGSAKWHAVEEILLDTMSTDIYRDDSIALLLKLGYVDHYEKQIRKKNVITRASAIDKLGKMRSARSVDKIVGFLKDEDPEIVTVTVRSLSKIGSAAGLRSILEEIPTLLSVPLVTVKTIETSIANFGKSDSIPLLIEYGNKYEDPVCRALILDMLSSLGAREAVPLALSNLAHADPEVRSKAVKIIGEAGDGIDDSTASQAAAMLSDPAWFVRLQAAKAMGNLRYENALEVLGDTLLDTNWQVRNAVATALTKFGNRSIDIFLGTLLYKDRYAKESICEEIQRTGFIDTLFENINATDISVYKKSKRILEIMRSINYCAPFQQYLNNGANRKTRYEIEIIMSQEHASDI